ncbi:carbon storage regulator [Lachnospiraceae bacterium PF1-21]|uniref:Translational regulator CsrA n=1 Tax=Ohessyouella blattaphilus TaxID=2949333 RepID=A0ABT1EEP3_9FIRM|nr:carbon storage regulator [Ohessyouella blattaphilus]MCP1109158.1 carbon storage regulator [Ohessyouella blattaphilus]MCR8562552.1 carbon storage regulator [Ohessyouella blattaphilus]MDL2250260.1 carbon storage regulator [Lachnospiraceae bacterium OttesenSCG-928-J05]
MLVLQRKKGEKILIGEDICLTVTEVGADSVKLAIEAPGEVKILRGELAEAIAFNQEAAQAVDVDITKKMKEWQSLV